MSVLAQAFVQALAVPRRRPRHLLRALPSRPLQPCRAFPPRRVRAPRPPPHTGIHFRTSIPVCASPSASPVQPLSPGLLLHVQLSAGRRRLVRALRPDGKRNWLVEDASGATASVAPKQVLFKLGHPDEVPALNVSLDALDAEATQRASDAARALDAAWELFVDEPTPPSPSGDPGATTTSATLPTAQADAPTVETLADVLLGDASPLDCFATHLALLADSTFFKSRNVRGVALYEPRPPAVVEEVRAARLVADAREAEREAQHVALRSALAARDIDAFRSVMGDEADALESALRQLALQADAPPPAPAAAAAAASYAMDALPPGQAATVKETLAALGLPQSPGGALALLVALRVHPRHVNLALMRADIPHVQRFDDDVEAAVERVLQAGATGSIPDADADARVDLRELTTYAVDSADTREVDDAFSWDEADGRVYIHIADPSRFFPDGVTDAIVAAAMRRSSTLYLPYTKFTMFPERLAVQLLSLDAPLADGAALTFSFQLEEDGRLVEGSTKIYASRVSRPVRLTYEAAEAAIADDGHEHHAVLAALFRRAVQRRDWREMEGGAIIINTPMCDVHVSRPDSDEPGVSVRSSPTDTPAWTLVSELMITACGLAADAAAAAQLPVVFRGQDAFDYPPDDVLDAVPDGPVRAALAFRNATPSEMGPEPREHASLGLDAYLQVTSPIRRATDLLAHVQLKALLRGDEPPLDAAAVQAEIARAATVARGVRGVESRTNRYWQFEFLRRLGDKPLDGTVVRPPVTRDSAGPGEGRRPAFVHLDEFGFAISAEAMPNAVLGDKVSVTVTSVNPRGNFIRATARPATKEREVLAAQVGTVMDDVLSTVSSEEVDDGGLELDVLQ